WQAGRQIAAQFFEALQPLARLLAELALGLGRQCGDLDAELAFGLTALGEQPVIEPTGGAAVVLVVASYPIELVIVTGLTPALEGPALLGAVVRPQWPVGPRPFLVAIERSEEVFESLIAPVRVALEVEEHVAGRGIGQAVQAASMLGPVQRVQRNVEPPAAD